MDLTAIVFAVPPAVSTFSFTGDGSALTKRHFSANDSQTWIQWNPNTKVWECCGNEGCNGSSPSETFSAIARASWSPIKTAPQSSTAPTFPSSTSSSLSSMTSMGPNVNGTQYDEGSDSSEGTMLSTGAQAGIGVACGLFGLAAVLAIGLLMIKRYKKRRGTDGQGQEQGHVLPDVASVTPSAATKYLPMDGLASAQPHEPTPQPKPELSADYTARVELEGHNNGTKSS